jgi:hypothetical protein
MSKVIDFTKSSGLVVGSVSVDTLNPVIFKTSVVTGLGGLTKMVINITVLTLLKTRR